MRYVAEQIAAGRRVHVVAHYRRAKHEIIERVAALFGVAVDDDTEWLSTETGGLLTVGREASEIGQPRGTLIVMDNHRTLSPQREGFEVVVYVGR